MNNKIIIKPKVSIITVTYNAETILEETLLSIINQTYDNIELIIVDGQSKDGTVEIIKKYEKHITKWVSESDEGIFDAMNKGIAMATGTWVNFMNAGDLFMNENVLTNIEFLSNQDTALIYGNTCREGRRVTYPFPTKNLETGGMIACHQSMFFNMDILENDLLFKDEFRSLNRYGDVELVARIYSKGYKLYYQDIIIAYFEGQGASSKINRKASLLKFRYITNFFGIMSLVKTLWYKFVIGFPYKAIKKDTYIK